MQADDLNQPLIRGTGNGCRIGRRFESHFVCVPRRLLAYTTDLAERHLGASPTRVRVSIADPEAHLEYHLACRSEDVGLLVQLARIQRIEAGL